MLAIEREHGRIRQAGVRWQARVLDLDLLCLDVQIIEQPGLSVPHPAMTERPFVMAPAAVLSREWRHPVAGRTLGELARVHADADGIVLHTVVGWWRGATESTG